MIVTDGTVTLELTEANYRLAEALFSKWGYQPTGSELKVQEASKISSELSAWGIPWRFI